MNGVASALAAARGRIRSAGSILVLTGAGMSAESGVPTFRDAQTGLWAKFDPMQLASPEGFRADPKLVWSWYQARRDAVRRAVPNPGHIALAQAQRRGVPLQIATQNVDGLHTRAGSTGVAELHGNILHSKCFAECGVRYAADDVLPSGVPPRCPNCGHWLRPSVVWFNEMLDGELLTRAERWAAGCDVALVVGTSGMVYPAAGLPRTAAAQGATVIVVNPQPSDLDDVGDILVGATAAQALPAMFDTA
jgi:NAD-dependent deacetylase